MKVKELKTCPKRKEFDPEEYEVVEVLKAVVIGQDMPKADTCQSMVEHLAVVSLR